MQPKDELTVTERELLAGLGRLRPARSGFSRDELMFQAGRTSARRQSRRWQGVSTVLVVALAASLAVQLTSSSHDRRQRVQSRRYADSTVVVSQDAWARPRGATSYLRIRNEVLAKGVDALPEPSWHSSDADDDNDQFIRPLRRTPRDSDNHLGNS